MNKLKITIFAMMFSLNIIAEEHIQVVPFETATGVTFDDCKPFSMNMVNTNSYTAMEFHLILPEGITLDMSYPFDMNADRFPGVTKRGVFYPNHDYNITNPATGDYYIKIYNTNNEKIDGTEGELLTFYYSVAEDMLPGYYPIKITGAILGVDSHTGIYPEASVSWVKVGSPSANAMLDLGNYAIPSFVEAKIPSKNVIINSVCANLELADGESFLYPSEFTATTASYSRQMTTEWGTVCLPFNVTSNESVEYYAITGIANSMLTIEKYNVLPAGTPALMRKVAGEGVSVVAKNVPVSNNIIEVSDNVNMFGAYSTTKVENANAYYINENKFWQCNDYFYCGPFRAYFSLPPSQANARCYEINYNTTTAISTLTGEDSNMKVEATFDANGIKTSSLKQGINILKLSNGTHQTVIIK